MPIRFRCAYCNQLMGISSRKAGTVVRCPKCAGEIIVPSPEGVEPPAEPTEQAAGVLPFEDLNIESFVDAPTNGSAIAAENPFAASPEPLPPPPPPPPPKRVGLFLPLSMLIVSLAVVILLLILVFILGIIIGKQH
jgi:DNA-directed RNA polymerase subunit RPC12/RpoP